MELKVKEMQLPEVIEFNYDEVKNWVAKGVEKYSKYDNIIMDADAVKVGKADRAELNKVKEALNKERIRQEKEYMKPFNQFKSQVNELISMIDEPVKLIDKAVKGYEAEQKAQKEAEIKAIFELEAAEAAAEIRLDAIWDAKWLNASVSLKKVQETIHERIQQFNSDIETLQKLPEFAFEAVETYKQTLDINKAISEGQRLADIQRRKQEAEAEKARLKAEEEARKAAAAAAEAETATPETDMGKVIDSIDRQALKQAVTSEAAKRWIGFEALLTVEQARELKQFFDSKNIEFRAASKAGLDQEKAAEIMTAALSYAYCDNCGTEEQYCDECHRKYQNWSLNEGTAAGIVEKIVAECL